METQLLFLSLRYYYIDHDTVAILTAEASCRHERGPVVDNSQLEKVGEFGEVWQELAGEVLLLQESAYSYHGVKSFTRCWLKKVNINISGSCGKGVKNKGV